MRRPTRPLGDLGTRLVRPDLPREGARPLPQRCDRRQLTGTERCVTCQAPGEVFDAPGAQVVRETARVVVGVGSQRHGGSVLPVPTLTQTASYHCGQLSVGTQHGAQVPLGSVHTPAQ